MSRTFKSWRDYPVAQWRWPNFSAQELACRGTGNFKVDEDALDKLQRLRERLAKPLIITSAYRSPTHNRNVGGATNSVHMTGRAFDISMSNHEPNNFERVAR